MKITTLWSSPTNTFEESWLVAAIDEYSLDGGGWFTDSELAHPNLRYLEIDIDERHVKRMYDMATVKGTVES